MKIAICDDNKIELLKIQNSVQQFIQSHEEDTITLKSFTNGLDLLDSVKHISEFDLFILDIIMPAINGIDLATEIRETNKDCKIIFITSSPEFAIKSYKVDAFFYLLKPFDENELESLLNKTLESIEAEQSKGIIVKDKTGLRRIDFKNILYIESIKHTLNFHLFGGDVVICYAKMDAYKDNLALENRFIRCHQSYIVNMDKITCITNQFFTLTDKTLIPISRAIYANVKSTYIDFFFGKGSGTKL